MLASELFNAINKIAPPYLALKNDRIGYLGPGNPEEMEIDKVQVRMDILPWEDPSNSDLVVCHHTPLFEPDFPVYVVHSNWDIVNGGANDALAECLNLWVLDVLDEKTGIGRICSTVTTIEKFIKNISRAIPTDHIKIVGNQKKIIKKIAVVSGFGLNNLEYINLAYKKGADVYISGDLTHQSAILAEKLGLCVIDATHHATEIPGLIKLCDFISKLGVKTEFVDAEVPWKTIKI